MTYMLGEIKRWLGVSLLLGVAIGPAAAQATVPLAPARERALIHKVRQDCGTCHGRLLTGGLGPALTPEALADKPVESLAATIYHGRPGTPMPPWKAMLNEAEADWIAQRLRSGFPQESRR